MKGPTWCVPVEVVRALTNATGTALMLRHTLQHASFRPHADVVLTPNGFIADLTYETAKGAVGVLSVAVAAVPQENAFGRAA